MDQPADSAFPIDDPIAGRSSARASKPVVRIAVGRAGDDSRLPAVQQVRERGARARQTEEPLVFRGGWEVRP